jgi:hypothetical protein
MARSRTKVTCHECGGEEFRVAKEAGGCVTVECIGCREGYHVGSWSAPAGGRGEDVEGDEAVGEVGDVEADLVPPAEGAECPECVKYRAKKRDHMRRYRARKAAEASDG